MPNPASVPELNLGDRVLDEVEKNSFIALLGKGGRSGLRPSKPCVRTWKGNGEVYHRGSKRAWSALDGLLIGRW